MLTLSKIECLQSKAVVFFGSALSLEILRIPPPAYNFCPPSMKSGYHSGYRLINDQGMAYFAMVYFKGTALWWPYDRYALKYLLSANNLSIARVI